MFFWGHLGKEMSNLDGTLDKGVETYNFFAILEITVAEGKAKCLMVSRHLDRIIGPKVSK